MKIEGYFEPKSSFLSIEKDLNIIVSQILKNERLKKLLFYTSRDALSKPNLSEEESLDLFGKNIKFAPKLYIDKDVLNYIFINFDNFVTNGTNPEFRDNDIEFDILCHYDQWNLKDFQIRPYRIAAELDTLFNDKHLTGIGTLEFLDARIILMTDEFAGICLRYNAIHGGEDRFKTANPKDQDQFEKEFKALYRK